MENNIFDLKFGDMINILNYGRGMFIGYMTDGILCQVGTYKIDPISGRKIPVNPVIPITHITPEDEDGLE